MAKRNVKYHSCRQKFFFSRKDTVEGLDEKFKDGRGHFQGAELDPNGEIIFVLKWHLVD